MDIKSISEMIAKSQKGQLQEIAGKDDNASHRLWANTALQFIEYADSVNTQKMVDHLMAKCDGRVELQLGAVKLCKNAGWLAPLEALGNLPSGQGVRPEVLAAVREALSQKTMPQPKSVGTIIKGKLPTAR